MTSKENEQIPRSLERMDNQSSNIDTAALDHVQESTIRHAASDLPSGSWTRANVLEHWTDEEPSEEAYEGAGLVAALESPIGSWKEGDRWHVIYRDYGMQRWTEFLATRFSSRRPSFEECLPLVEAAFELFEEIHKAGLVVGDFDGEYVLVEEAEPSGLRFKFLLSRPLFATDHRSRQGTVPTRAFDAPEFRNGQAHLWSPASDVFVIGAWLIALLAGRSCFADFDEVIYLGHQLRAFCPDVPFTLHPWFGRSCALQPTDRYRSIAEQRTEFERLARRHADRRAPRLSSLRLGLGTSSRMGIGKLRDEDDFRSPNDVNEDRAFAQWSSENDGLAIALVADGVTNCRYGSGACAAEIVKSDIERAWIDGRFVSRESLRTVLVECNAKVVQEALRIAESGGANLAALSPSDLMGATVALCVVLEQETHIAGCGDARVYLWCVEDGLALLSFDTNQLRNL